MSTRDRYLPYGGNRNATGKWTMPTDRGWQGQIQDADTGLDYLNARYYDPALAHFISADEMTDNDQTAAANPYGYAAANPILFNDPTGLWPGFVKKAASFVSDHSDTIADIAVGVAVGAPSPQAAPPPPGSAAPSPQAPSPAQPEPPPATASASPPAANPSPPRTSPNPRPSDLSPE